MSDMFTPTQVIRRLAVLAPRERRDALASLVIDVFKVVLLMGPDEDIDWDTNFFDLGFTSLRLVEAKQKLQELFGRTVSVRSMVNWPTLNYLMAHLTDDVLSDMFTAGHGGTGDSERRSDHTERVDAAQQDRDTRATTAGPHGDHL